MPASGAGEELFDPLRVRVCEGLVGLTTEAAAAAGGGEAGKGAAEPLVALEADGGTVIACCTTECTPVGCNRTSLPSSPLITKLVMAQVLRFGILLGLCDNNQPNRKEIWSGQSTPKE